MDLRSAIAKLTVKLTEHHGQPKKDDQLHADHRRLMAKQFENLRGHLR